MLHQENNTVPQTLWKKSSTCYYCAVSGVLNICRLQKVVYWAVFMPVLCDDLGLPYETPKPGLAISKCQHLKCASVSTSELTYESLPGVWKYCQFNIVQIANVFHSNGCCNLFCLVYGTLTHSHSTHFYAFFFFLCLNQ